MLDEGELILRFLDQARSHVKERIIMCHLDLAGDTNNPRVHGPKFGYRVAERSRELLTTGEQQGFLCPRINTGIDAPARASLSGWTRHLPPTA